MSEFCVKKLILASPLKYEKDNALRFPAPEFAEGETLFFMALDPSRSRGIEPDRRAFPGRLIIAGTLPSAEGAGTRTEGTGKSAGTEAPLDGGLPMPAAAELSGPLELSAGTYLFAQVRELPDMEKLIDMIIEVQQEGLWERLSLDDRLYIRYLFEDGQPVTQVFRPVVI
jgi:hypothetical protein